jgi:nucleotide-binding universal stress UspA family protein
VGPVICCVDDSEHARKALAVGRELAASLDLPLVLLHVAPLVTAPGVSAAVAGHERLKQSEIDEAQQLLSHVVHERALGDDVELRVEVGDAPERITAVCTELDASFVVLGSHGRGGVRKLVLGSVSSKVATTAPCPVVIVPPRVAARTDA